LHLLRIGIYYDNERLKLNPGNGKEKMSIEDYIAPIETCAKLREETKGAS